MDDLTLVALGRFLVTTAVQMENAIRRNQQLEAALEEAKAAQPERRSDADNR